MTGIRILSLALLAARLSVAANCLGFAGDKPHVVTPDVQLQASPETGAVNKGNDLKIALVINNNGAVALQNINVTLLPESNEFAVSSSIPETLAAFGASTGVVTVKTTDNAAFGKHKITLFTQYQWMDGTEVRSSGRALPVEFEVDRQFEEEAKALPGGSSAMLYLILPIVTVFLSYGMMESLRKGQGLQIPEFKAAYIAPAFLVGILLNLAMLAEIKHDESFVYADPKTFGYALFAFAVAGCFIPAIRWIGQGFRWWRWAYSEDDSTVDYLQKVLRVAKTGMVDWAVVTVKGEDSEGILLSQPDGTIVLGQQLQVFLNADKAKDGSKLDQVVDAKGKVLDAETLLAWARQGKVDFQPLQFIQLSANKYEGIIALLGTADVQVKTREEVSLLTPVS